MNMLATVSLSRPVVSEQTVMLPSPGPVVKACKPKNGLVALDVMAAFAIRGELECSMVPMPVPAVS